MLMRKASANSKREDLMRLFSILRPARYPMWSRNGHELFFETLDNHIMVAAHTVKGDSFVTDKPRVCSEKTSVASAATS